MRFCVFDSADARRDARRGGRGLFFSPPLLLGVSLALALLVPPGLAVAGGIEGLGTEGCQDEPAAQDGSAYQDGPAAVYETPERQEAAAEETRRKEEAMQRLEEERQRAAADSAALSGAATSLGAGAVLLDEAAVQAARQAAGTELSPEQERLERRQEAQEAQKAASDNAFGKGLAGMAGVYAVAGTALLMKARAKARP